jgi:3-methyladenine DNA glycosylase AlkD
MANAIIEAVRDALIRSADDKTKATSQNFFKEKIQYYGVKVPTVHKISKEYFKQIEGWSKAEIFALCKELWRSGYLEASFIACNWSFAIRDRYEVTDFPVFADWIHAHVNNWASCDTFCNHTLGTFMEMYPECLPKLQEFAVDENRWLRRAAAVTLIVPARKGKFLKEILEIADLLLMDPDDMVQKGYGWMLKSASEAHREEIYAYVLAKKAVMPRTALRYAIEKMPKEMRAVAMKK